MTERKNTGAKAKDATRLIATTPDMLRVAADELASLAKALRETAADMDKLKLQSVNSTGKTMHENGVRHSRKWLANVRKAMI